MTKYTPDDGPDVDLAAETVLLKSGTRLTPGLSDEIADELTERRLGGRPSLSGRRAHSPAVSFRLDPETLARVQQRAEQEQVSVSQLARRALEQLLAN